MPPRQSGTYRRSAAPHTERGTMVLVEDGVLQARSVIRHLRGPTGYGVPVEWARDLAELQAVVHPLGHHPVGRRRVRGFLLDFWLGDAVGDDALSVLAWLRAIYPRTPAVVYTGSSAMDIERAAAGRARFVRAENAGSEDVRDGVLAKSMLGVLEPPDGTQVLVLRKSACGPDTLDVLDQRVFAPWDRRCIALRKWLLAEAREGAFDLKEYHLCTLDAYFDSLAISELCVARGVSASTLEQNLKEIRALYGVKDVDILRARWERFRLGRGASRPAEPPWLDERPERDRDTHDRDPDTRGARGGTVTRSYTRLTSEPARRDENPREDENAPSSGPGVDADDSKSSWRRRRPSARRQPRADPGKSGRD